MNTRSNRLVWIGRNPVRAVLLALVGETLNWNRIRREKLELRCPPPAQRVAARFAALAVSSGHSSLVAASPSAQGCALASIQPGGSLAGKESMEATST